ncbi:MAG: hypothetical protein L0287_33805 [Anaerolineae bacterium]|nr:hypothetical protein [Anaerolineae bacterium]
MRLTNLTNLIIQLNKLLDTGKYTWISPRDVKQQIETGEIFRYIADRGKADIDLSFLNGNTEAEIVAALRNIFVANAGKELGKWGVVNNGLCMLLASVSELIQMGAWVI